MFGSTKGIKKIAVKKLYIVETNFKEVENINRDSAGFDLNYDEFKNFCREAWTDDYI